MKKIPLRTCIVTKEQCEKRDLLRVVKTKDGNISVDETGKANGRGAYIKKDADVIYKAQKNKILDRVFEVNVPDNIYDKLQEMIKND